MKKRFFSFLLALVMVIGLVPATALTASAATMTTSEAGIELIKSFEGFHANAYRDNGQWSIGYGTASTEGATITREEADTAMRAHVARLETAINTFAGANSLSLTQAQFDALISFSYNCGTAWTAGSGKFRSAVLNKTTGNDFLYAICLWANVGSTPNTGLIKRRLCEANLYLNGKYSATAPANYTYVLLDANGGDVGEDKMQGYDSNTSASIKAVPTNSGKTFAGWYTAKSGGTKVTALGSAQAGKTLYAMWGTAVKVTNSYVNVRNAAGTVGTTVTKKLYMNDTVVIFETKTVNDSLWGRYDGGWIALMYTDYKASPDKNETAAPESGSNTGNSETVVATATVSCNTYVNVRNAAGTVGTTVVGKLANGTKVDIYEIKVVNGHKWGRISNGWFCLDYAVMNTGNTGSTGNTGNTGSSAAGTVLRTGYVSHSYVNVRNAAGTIGTTVVGQLNKGAKVNIYEFKTVNGRQWARIDGGRWVCMDYVTLDAQTGGNTGNSGNTGNTGNSGSGATESEILGTLLIPVGTNLYDQYGDVIATANSEFSDKAYALGTFEGSPEFYYELEDGYVKADGLVLTLAVPEAYVAAKNTNGYATVGAASSTKVLNKDTAVTVTKMVIKGETVWAYVSGTNLNFWVDAADLDEPEAEAPGAGDNTGNSGNNSNTGNSGNTGSNGSTGTDNGVLRTGYVSNSYVNVRNAAGTVGTTVVGQLKQGAKVSIYEFKTVNGHQWARIDGNRWICMDYVTLDPQTGSNTGSTGTTTPGTGNSGNAGNTGSGNAGNTGSTGGKAIATGFVTSSTLNIRTGPGTGYATAGALSKNARFEVYEYKLANGMIWGRIGTNKWICLSYTLLDSTGTPTGAGEMATVIKTGYAVNIRSTTSTAGALMGKMLINSRVEILETKVVGATTWGRISLGWVSMEYIMLDSQLPPGMTPEDMLGGTTGTAPEAGTGSTTTPDAGTNNGTGSNAGTTAPDAGEDDGNTGVGLTGPLFTGSVILTNSLKVRQTPSTSGAELGTLARGTAVTIYDVCVAENMAWGQCDKGWICLVYVDLVPLAGSGAVDVRIVQYDGLNIREGAGTQYKSVGTYSKNQIVHIYEFSGNWGRTAEGWVHLDYLLT